MPRVHLVLFASQAGLTCHIFKLDISLAKLQENSHVDGSCSQPTQQTSYTSSTQTQFGAFRTLSSRNRNLFSRPLGSETEGDRQFGRSGTTKGRSRP